MLSCALVSTPDASSSAIISTAEICGPLSTVAEFAEERDGLQPAEGLLDQLPLALTQGIARMTRGATINRAAAEPGVLGHVRRDAHPAHGPDPGALVVQLVRRHGDAATCQRQLADHGDRRVAFAGAAGVRHRRVDDEAMAILGQQMPEIGQLRLVAGPFLIQPRVGVGRRLMGVVAPHLPVEIHRRILRVVGRRPVRALGFETLVAGPRLEERAVDGEMLVGQQSFLFDRGEHFRKERVRDVAVEQSVAILREGRGILDRIVEA